VLYGSDNVPCEEVGGGERNGGGLRVEGKWLDEDNSHTRDHTQKRIPAVAMPATDITTHQFRFVNGELRAGPLQGDYRVSRI
jgi:hypothetical protein